MKRLTIPVLFVTTALVLSSCSLHLGLSSLLGGNKASSSSTTKAAKTPHAASGTSAAPANPDALTIAGGKFRPKNVSVKVGTTLTWTNNDTQPESVTSDTPNLFDSGVLQPGAKWTYTFQTAGTFPYHSTTSKTTFGSVTVTP